MKKRRCSMSFWIYYDNKKIKSIDSITDKESGTIILIEKHYLLYKFWYLLIIFFVIIGFLGGSYSNTAENLIIIEINYKKIDSDNFFVEVNKKKEKINVTGVKEYEIISLRYDVPLKVDARKQRERKIVIFIALASLFIIFMLILLSIIF